MWTAITHAMTAWSDWYSNSAILRSSVGFLHVAGLVVGGGAALVEDRAILGAGGYAAARRRTEVRINERAAHGVVLSGLAVVVASGVMLFAADFDTYLHSSAFWIKMALVVLLLANGYWLQRAEVAFEASERAWPALRRAASLSLALWLLTTLAGAVLPNV